jgi:hypothetical protein
MGFYPGPTGTGDQFMLLDDVLILPDFGTEADVLALLTAFEAAVAGSFVPQFRTLVPCRNIDSVCEPETFEQVVAIRTRMLATMQRAFSTTALPDLTILAEMRAGDSHLLHADAERQAADGWEPNHSFWRTHAGVLYLNTSGVDYEGGILQLPGVDQAIVPTRGLFAAFPSGRRHVHEVTEIKAGRRRTLSIWLTMDPSRVESIGLTGRH